MIRCNGNGGIPREMSSCSSVPAIQAAAPSHATVRARPGTSAESRRELIVSQLIGVSVARMDAASRKNRSRNA